MTFLLDHQSQLRVPCRYKLTFTYLFVFECWGFFLQILHLSHSQKPGEVIAWVLADNDMFKIPLQIPRTFYLNTQAPNSEEYPGACVTRVLPHGHTVFNLIEVNFKHIYTSLFDKNYWWHMGTFLINPFFDDALGQKVHQEDFKLYVGS